MNRRPLIILAVVALALTLAYSVTAYTIDVSQATRTNHRIERGRYLVTAFGCADCHSPLTMGPEGPCPDPEHFLAGHPADMPLPPAPTPGPGPWIVRAAATNTAWAGPWGTSFTSNLTPDVETGIGSWTADDFVKTVKSGRHLGLGRQLLPPMPVAALSTLTDEDLRAMYAFLRSVPAVVNRVPDPLPPAGL